MAEYRQQRQKPEQRPSRRDEGLFGPAPMPEPNNKSDRKRHYGCPQKRVCNAAVVFKACHRTAKSPENIHIWRFGREGHGQGCVSGPAIEPGAGTTGTVTKMGAGFHGWSNPSAA